MSLVSGKSIIDKALLIAGINGIGNYQSATGVETADSLDTLNFIINSWKIEGLLNFASQVVEYVPTTGSFTMGPTGDLVVARPPKITDAYCRINSGTGAPLDIVMTQLNAQDYDSIALKSMTMSITRYFYYEPTDPDGTMYIWPEPQPGQTTTIRMRYDQLLSEFDTADDEIQMPPGYKMAIVYALADQLCMQYGISNPAISMTAMTSKDTLKRNNVRSVPLRYDGDAPGSIGGIYDARYGVSF